MEGKSVCWAVGNNNDLPITGHLLPIADHQSPIAKHHVRHRCRRCPGLSGRQAAHHATVCRRSPGAATRPSARGRGMDRRLPPLGRLNSPASQTCFRSRTSSVTASTGPPSGTCHRDTSRSIPPGCGARCSRPAWPPGCTSSLPPPTARQVGRISPPEGLAMEAKLAERRKEYSSAEEQLRRALDVAPQQVGRFIDLARFLVRRGRLDEADQVLARAGKFSPNSPKLMYATAEIYVKAHHNLDVARELLKRYMSAVITPEDPPKAEAAKLLRQVQGG